MTAPDLTAITTPYGLLDRETQEALKAHGGPWEVWSPNSMGDRHRWVNVSPSWFARDVYRVKPALPKPRTIYLCEVHGEKRAFDTAMAATREALAYQHGEATVTEWVEVTK